LFVPARRERSILSTRREPGVRLYSHNVLIQEYCTDLFPKWLEFVDGIVDSEDLPLNVSRETVQNNRLMRHLGTVLRRRVVRELKQLSESDADKYAHFWREYQRVFKEGLTLEPTAKDEILPLFRFESTASDGALTSLDDYLARMPETQEEIYYVLGDDSTVVSRSPHLDPFKARNLEVLYWVDPLDAFIAPIVTDYKEKKLRNIDDAGLELPEPEGDQGAESEEPFELAEADFNRFVGRCVTTLGNRIIEVRSSKVLKSSPVRLVSPEDAPNREMERISRYLDRNYEVPRKILEVNRRHPLIIDLAMLVSNRTDDPFIKLAIEQLYEGALLQEGLHPNPAEMLPRIQEILETAARQKRD
jgi:molecular chaperone HtpG